MSEKITVHFDENWSALITKMAADRRVTLQKLILEALGVYRILGQKLSAGKILTLADQNKPEAQEVVFPGQSPKLPTGPKLIIEPPLSVD